MHDATDIRHQSPFKAVVATMISARPVLNCGVPSLEPE